MSSSDGEKVAQRQGRGVSVSHDKCLGCLELKVRRFLIYLLDPKLVSDPKAGRCACRALINESRHQSLKVFQFLGLRRRAQGRKADRR